MMIFILLAILYFFCVLFNWDEHIRYSVIAIGVAIFIYIWVVPDDSKRIWQEILSQIQNSIILMRKKIVPTEQFLIRYLKAWWISAAGAAAIEKNYQNNE